MSGCLGAAGQGQGLAAGCWAHGRRELFDLAQPSRTPLAAETVRRIDTALDAERAFCGLLAEQRMAIRQTQVAPNRWGWRAECGPPGRRCPATPMSAARWNTCSSTGVRSDGSCTAAGFAYRTTRPNEHCAAWPLRERPGCLRSGPWWGARCGHVIPYRHGQAERHRSARLAGRRSAPDRRPPGLALPRDAALELVRAHSVPLAQPDRPPTAAQPNRCRLPNAHTEDVSWEAVAGVAGIFRYKVGLLRRM